MLRRVLVFLALYCGSAAIAFAADPLDEVHKSFTIGGKPIPPEIFADFGDAWMSDSRPIVVTIDANEAIDSNRYADPHQDERPLGRPNEAGLRLVQRPRNDVLRIPRRHRQRRAGVPGRLERRRRRDVLLSAYS
jgi:hypothetical protein